MELELLHKQESKDLKNKGKLNCNVNYQTRMWNPNMDVVQMHQNVKIGDNHQWLFHALQKRKKEIKK